MLIKLNKKSKCGIIKYQLCPKEVLTWKKEKQFLLLKFYLFLKERMEHQYQFPYRYEKINYVDRIIRDVHCIFQNQYTERDAIKRYFHYEIR